MQCEITDIKHDLMERVESGRNELNFLDENDCPVTVPSSIKQLKSGKPVMEQRKLRFLPTEPQLHQDEEKFSPKLEQIYSASTNDSYAYQEDDFVPNYSDKEDSIFDVYLHQIRQIPQLSKSQETSLFIKIEKHKKIIQDSISELKSIFHDIEQDWEQLSVTEIEQLVENLLDHDSQKYADANMRHYSQYLIDIIARSRKQIQIAKDRIVESNLRLVVYIAQKYNARGLTLSDLIQEGNTGLMTAVDRYEYQRGAKFSAYASCWIQQAIGHAIANQDRVIRLPAYVGEIMRKVTRASEQFRKEQSRTPNNEEIAEITGLSPVTLEKLSKTAMDVSSLDDFIDEEKENSNLNFIEDERIPTPEQQVTMACLQNELEQVLKSLPPREEQIIRLRYGLDDGCFYSLQEIGSRFNLSRERVRQLESRALDRLRHPARSAKLQEFLTA